MPAGMIKRSKYISWKECSQNGNTYIIFFKIAEEDPFHVLWYENETNGLKPMTQMMNVRNVREVTMKVKKGYVVLHVINGTITTWFYE